MYNIILLSSMHMQLGNCNSNELYKIIEKIQPEIIFEELPYDIFQMIYSEGFTPQSLEAIAIKEYLKKYVIKHFPVDTLEMDDKDIFTDFDKISAKSSEYTQLINYHFSMIKQHGYSFLNNSEIVGMFDEMHKIEKDTLAKINDSELVFNYKAYTELNERRDIEMLKNIYNYSRLHQYNIAIFICGAEHRGSIIQKILECERNEKFKLNWTFYNNYD